MSTEREIQLSSIIGVILSRGVRIGIFSLGFMVLAALYSLTIANRYQSETVLVMNTSKLGERSMQNPPIPIETFETILFPKEVIRDTWAKFKLEDAPVSMDKFDDLEGRIDVRIEEGSLSISIKVELEDPQLAADVTNELATQAILLNRKLMENEQKRNFEIMQSEFSKADVLTESRIDKHRQMIINNRKPILMNELDTLNTLIATNRQLRENLLQSIIELQTRKEYFEDVLSASDFQPLIQVESNVLGHDTLREILQEQGQNSVKDLSDLSFRQEAVNPQYYILMMEYKKVLVDLPGQEEKLKLIEANTEIYEASAALLQEEFFGMEVDEFLSQAERDRFIEIMGGIQKELYWTGTTTFSERQDLDQIGTAIANDRKVYPQRGLMVMLGGMIAFLMAFLYYLLTDLYGLVLTGIRKDKTQDAPAST